MTRAENVVRILLDATGDDVEVEYARATIDSMPHVLWMIRDTAGTHYLANGTAHNMEKAKEMVGEKVKLLGVRVVKVTDHSGL